MRRQIAYYYIDYDKDSDERRYDAGDTRAFGEDYLIMRSI